MKLLGKNAMSEPDISITFRMAITHSIKLSWKRSTMSAVNTVAPAPYESVADPEDEPAHMIWNKFSFSNFLNTAGGQLRHIPGMIATYTP